ncbi:MAG TPA: hypothetical protein VMI54_25270 [Polyangiaceae bacterium]|nr:hypothetical protein [Polyangiaceae bacterium]
MAWRSLAATALVLAWPLGCSSGSKGDTEPTACTSDADCPSGEVCGALNGACFGFARAHTVCWPPSCTDDQLSDCGAPGRACGKNCSCVTACNADDAAQSCPSGEVCQRELGYALHGWFRDACGDPRCASGDPSLCGDQHAVCGACVCTQDCSSATCDDPSDGCGGVCIGVCADYSPCPTGGGCGVGFQCLSMPDGVKCLPAECAIVTLAPPLCGTASAFCGPTCPN